MTHATTAIMEGTTYHNHHHNNQIRDRGYYFCFWSFRMAAIWTTLAILLIFAFQPLSRYQGLAATVVFKSKSNSSTNYAVSSTYYLRPLPPPLLQPPPLPRNNYNNRHNNHSDFFPPPQVVILPGPHKTGSTSLQTCLVDWTMNGHSRHIRQRKENPVTTPLALPRWSWAVPDQPILGQYRLNHQHPTKAFASLMGIADRDATLGFTPQGRNDTNHTVTTAVLDAVRKTYQAPMEKAWRSNYNIIYGSEEMDRLVNPVHSNSSFLMDTILNILPWNAKGSSAARQLHLQDLEVVLFHRTPRVKHLTSAWHQERMEQESLRDYLWNRLLNHVRYVDALGIAQQFLRRNIRTTIIDVEGVKATYGNRTNTCHVIACDILQTEECTDDTHRLSFLAANPTLDISDEPQNQREDQGGMDLTLSELDAIDKIMTEYDCGFQGSLMGFRKRSLLRYLYKDNLFEGCAAIKNGTLLPQRSLRWMVDNIRAVIMP